MNKLTLIVVGFAAIAGCKGKDGAKQAPPTQTGSAQSAGDPKWAERLPSVTGGDMQMLMSYAIGLVRVDADGSLHFATAPATPATDPRTPGPDPFATSKVVTVDTLGEELGLPPIVARPESAYGVIEGSGSAGSGSGSGSGSGAGSGSGSAVPENPADAAFARLGHPVAASGAPAPAKRVTTAFALAHPNDVSGGVMVFADAMAPAGTLVDVLAQTGGFLAVKNGAKLGALALSVDRHAPVPVAPHKAWFELRLGKTIELESVPGKPVAVESLAKLGAAVKGAGVTAIDVLVGPDTRVQDIVTVVEQLRGAEIDAIGFGRLPAADAGARGEQGPRVIAWDFYMADIDEAAGAKFQAALDPTYEPMRGCYRAALAKTPDVGGTAQLAVFVAPNGKVSGAEAQGVSPALVECAVTAAKAATFPPAGTAGAKVAAKITFVPR